MGDVWGGVGVCVCAGGRCVCVGGACGCVACGCVGVCVWGWGGDQETEWVWCVWVGWGSGD